MRTCEDCICFEDCINESAELGQVFDSTYDGENHCGMFRLKTINAGTIGGEIVQRALNEIGRYRDETK